MRKPGYFKCVPVFLGKLWKAAWCPQQLALNSWQLLHLSLRRVPVLHQGLVLSLNLAQNLPWRMTLMVREETLSKGTDVKRNEKEMLPVQFHWLLRNTLTLLWRVCWWICGALGQLPLCLYHCLFPFWWWAGGAEPLLTPSMHARAGRGTAPASLWAPCPGPIPREEGTTSSLPRNVRQQHGDKGASSSDVPPPKARLLALPQTLQGQPLPSTFAEMFLLENSNG